MVAFSWRRRLRFLIGGAANFFVTYGVLLVSLSFVPVSASSFLSSLTNFVLGYGINRRYVFGLGSSSHVSSHLVRYGALSVASWILNWTGIVMIHAFVGLTNQQASLVMILPLALFSYVGQSRFVFVVRGD